jgi:hypothetical protein
VHLTALLPVVVLVALLAALVAALAPRRQPATDLTDVVTSPAAHARARRHAGVVAAIAWGALAVVAAALPAAAPAGAAGGVLLGSVPAAAGTAFLLAAAVGERTWPRPTGARRRASLVPRTARDVAPRALRVALATWTATLLLVLLGTGLTATADGRSVSRTLDAQLTAEAGPYPGPPYAVPLALGALLVAAGAAGVLHLVARRPAVEGVSTADDDALRVASGGRVLAGVQLVVGATLAGVLLFAGQALRNVAHGAYAVDDVWTTVTDPLTAGLGWAALVAAPLVALTTVALTAVGLARAARATAPAVAA